MSTIKVDSIKSSDGNTDLLTLSNGSVSGVNFGRRNLIINGAMQVAQRGTVSITTNSWGGVDRFQTFVNDTGATVSTSQSSNAPDGFANSVRIETTTAGSFPSSAYNLFGTRFEGQDLQHLAYGTSSAKTITASFWVRCSQTGTVNLEIRNEDTSRHNIAQYTIDSANTWEYKTLTFSGDTVGSIPNVTTGEVYFLHWLKSGSDFTGGTAPTNGFVSAVNSNFGEGATVDIISGVGRYIEFTGVQLEVGSVATPFEHRSYGEELALCMRYYNRLGLFYQRFYSSSLGSVNPDLVDTVTFPPMRDAPVVNPYTDSAYSSSGSTNTSSTTQTITNISISSMNVQADRTGSGAGAVSTQAYLELVSEL